MSKLLESVISPLCGSSFPRCSGQGWDRTPHGGSSASRHRGKRPYRPAVASY